jgi:single-strand DNA-binding protein
MSLTSFTLNGIGNLTKNPEVIVKNDRTFTRFCLVGTDYLRKDEEGTTREVVTTMWFAAFGNLGEAIAKHARKGDQLIVQARVRAANWVKDGEVKYDYSYTVSGFRFGAPGKARREELEARQEEPMPAKPEDKLEEDNLEDIPV